MDALKKLWITLREPARAALPWLLFALFALYASVAYLTPVRVPAAKPEAHADGVGYYAHLRSLVFDRDVSYENDYALLGQSQGLNPVTGLAVNVFPLGPTLFWAPFVPAAYFVQRHESEKVQPPRPIDGSEPPFQRTVFFGSVVAGLLTVALALVMARRITDPVTAALTSIGIAVCSPLLWYMVRQASYSHAADACSVALFGAYWLASAGARSMRRWVSLGLLLGLAMLTRPQNACHALLPLLEWSYVAYALLRARDGGALRRWIGVGAVFVLAALAALAPLLLLWRHLYGTWTLLPQGGGFMLWTHSRWDATLFSSRGGLYAWHPMLALATVGLVGLAVTPRFGRPLRQLAVCALGIIAMQAYINGAARDWWAGWAFGGRRFLSCTFYFALGLAAAVELLRGWVARHPRATVQVGAAALLSVFALLSQTLSEDYVAGRALPDGAQWFQPRYEHAVHERIAETYAKTGNVGAWPANLWFALRAHTSPARYDIAGADDIFPGERRTFVFDDGHAMGGFTKAEPVQGRFCSTTNAGPATWTFALRQRSRVEGLVSLRASAPGSHVRMQLKGATILDQPVAPEWHDYPLQIEKKHTSAGVNYVRVEQLGPGSVSVCWEKSVLESIK